MENFKIEIEYIIKQEKPKKDDVLIFLVRGVYSESEYEIEDILFKNAKVKKIINDDIYLYIESELNEKLLKHE